MINQIEAGQALIKELRDALCEEKLKHKLAMNLDIKKPDQPKEQSTLLRLRSLTCPICLDNLKLVESKRMLCCGQLMHQKCVDESYRFYDHCPYCRH